MLKVTKVLGVTLASLAGLVSLTGCLAPVWVPRIGNLGALGRGWGDGLDDFWTGVVSQGIVDSWAVDMVLDWLREDIFS